MKILSYRQLITLIFLSFVLTSLDAQKTNIYTHSRIDFEKGMDLFRKEKYGAAQRFFIKAAEASDNTITRSQAQYYSALSAIELSNDDAEYLTLTFIANNPESPLVNNAWFRLADYAFRKKSYPTAIKYYEKLNRFLLNEDEYSEYYFQLGYSHYSRRDYAEARVAFYEIKDIESKYSSPALYYYSHIAYEEGNYETALNGFLRLMDDETFSTAAPYYVAQIYYLQKKYDKVIAFAPGLLETVSDKRSSEMSRIIGESHFYLEQYAEALPYLERFRDETKNISIADRYQLAFTYYKTQDYDNAITLFQQITALNNEISQSALYHLADCYLKKGDKTRARSAFSGAARMEFDQAIQEDALFNFAKLTYELSLSPFNEAIRAFNSYINLYPDSRRIDEAYSYLVMAYLNTRNYRLAMESLEKIRLRDREMDKAYQRITFFRGLELFTNLRFMDAISTLDKSLKFGQYDPQIKARTLYWLAEAYYRQGDISTATEFYNLFNAETHAPNTPEYKMLNYSLGYLNFAKKEYEISEKWFTRYVQLEQDLNSVTYADAWNRLGDTRFIASSYWQAIENYDKVIKAGKADVPYAMFQKAFTLGLVDRPQRKIEDLLNLLALYPNSSYTDDALYELGRTYVLTNNNNEALKSYRRLINEEPNSILVPASLVQLGLIHRNAKENEKALEYYIRVVNEYPGTTEAYNSLKTIREIYVDLNRVDEYLAFIQKSGQLISISEQDSLMYFAAENVYLTGNCENAIPSLNNYIARFPEGGFLLNAHYYRADCLLRQNKADEAFSSLQHIIDQSFNLFTEPALTVGARIAFAKEDFNLSAQLYQQLIEKGQEKSNITEAEVGLMRSYYKLGEYTNTIKAAHQVLLQDKLQDEIKREARYYIADAFLKQNDPLGSYDWFARLSVEVNSMEGAEAKYRLSEIDFNRGEIARAEKNIHEFISMNTPHQYWMGKAFLLLSDIFISQNDDFQALQTLQSIIDYYPNEEDGIKDEALRRKEKISDKMNKINQPIEMDDDVLLDFM
jgi:TolA-binding protein